MRSEPADSPQAILGGLCETITPASCAQQSGARRRLRGAPGEHHDLLDRLAIWLAGARHAPRPATARKRIIVAAADHGVGDPGVDLGDDSPTREALRQIASGQAALCTAARGAGAEIALVDAGAWAGRGQIPGLVDMRAGEDGGAAGDIRVGPAMTEDEAAKAMANGVALVFSLAEQGLDVCALGGLGVGGEVASAAVIAALAGADPGAGGGAEAADARAALARNRPDPGRPLEVLARVGGFDIALLAGAALGAAAIDVPVVLDDHATAAAALVAAALAPSARDYVLASQAGSIPVQKLALSALELEIEPLIAAGVSRGEGTGAALALPALDAASALLRER